MKEKIIEFNKRFGLNTEFIIDSEIEGYSLGNTIYINENSSDIEKVNKHELLHFFENDETFQRIKDEILGIKEDKLKKIRSEYYLRYSGLYTEEEIQNGIIDIEIVIDILIDNFIFAYDHGLKIGDYVLKEITNNLEQKKYLNLSINNQVSNMKMSKWDKLFILNYYDGTENHIFPSKEGRQERIKQDIKNELERLYNLKEEDFVIYPNSKDLIREFENEIRALEARGESTTYLKVYHERFLEERATYFSNQLYEEYKHIVNYIKNTEYEDSFKVLMLRETLSKTYKLDMTNGKRTIVNKRDIHETITSHMNLNETVLNTIYNNVIDYNNFANLYFAGLDIFNQIIAKKNNISLENVETYGMGSWIKFEGKTSNDEEYLKNSQELSSLVKNTPWCTKSLASSQLAEGDFYVFVDDHNNPHIAVKMSGDEIDEVRGIQNGISQEIEEEYRKVALSFLENNKDIKHGKDWLRKEEWNERLINYINSIKNGTLKQEDIPKLLDDYLGCFEYKPHFEENSNLLRLINLLPKIKKNLAEYFNCTEDQIAIGEVDFSKREYNDVTVCPFTVIFGRAYFGNSFIKDLGNLTFIGGDADFYDSIVNDFGNLTTIGGSVFFPHSEIRNLGKLERIGGDAIFSHSDIVNLGNLTFIGGDADFSDSIIKNLGNLTYIGGDAYFNNSNIQTLANLKTIEGTALFCDSQVKDLGSLTYIGGTAYFGNSPIHDLANLTTIAGDAMFRDSEVLTLGNLTTIGGYGNFSYSQVKDLGNLTTIGDGANFLHCPIHDLGKLEKICGGACGEDNLMELFTHEFDTNGLRKNRNL